MFISILASEAQSPQQIVAQADRVAHRLRTATEDTLLFSSRHFMRVVAAAKKLLGRG